MSRLALGVLLATSILAGGCAEGRAEDALAATEDALEAKANEQWFYAGSLTPLESPVVTVSLAGNTARVSGLLPADAAPLPPLPHVQTKVENGRTRVDIVYPIATAKNAGSNSRPGTYDFQRVKPFRPNGQTFTVSAGNHFVTWGGFPFIEYNNNIAFHGPITAQDSQAGGTPVFYLRRGDVSGGCNRMLGENVVELAHVLGISMRKIYKPDEIVGRPAGAKTVVVADYDTLDGKFIDSDYATDVGVVRPANVHGAENVNMFGSWVASETPDGSDLPKSQNFEGGIKGKPYVFAEHMIPNAVCSFPQRAAETLRALATANGGELPRSLCEQKACILDTIAATTDAMDAMATCALSKAVPELELQTGATSRGAFSARSRSSRRTAVEVAPSH